MAQLCYVIILLQFSFVKSQQSLRSQVSDKFYHRQQESLKPYDSKSPALWSSGIRSSSTFFQRVCRCSRIFRNRQLVNTHPFEIAYTQSEQDCVVRCATTNSDMKVECVSLNYCIYDGRCELFAAAQTSYNGLGRCIPVTGCTYYVIDEACLGLTTLHPVVTYTMSPTAAPTAATFTTESTTITMLITAQTEATTTSGFFTDVSTTTTAFVTDSSTSSRGGGGGSPSTKSCPNGGTAVYSRAQGFVDPRINIPSSKVSNIASAADCQAECDKQSQCQSFDYIGGTRTCNIYNSVNKDAVQPQSDGEHGDSLCVPASSNCHGTIDRIPNKVQFSSPTTETAISASDCISKCLSTKPCLAVSYFANANKDNCLLSQQSRQTDPGSFLDAKGQNVNYYGLDACSSAKLSARKFVIRNHEQVPPDKQAKQSQVKSANQLLAQNSPGATHLPNAKEYRQMVVAAQHQKASSNKKQ